MKNKTVSNSISLGTIVALALLTGVNTLHAQTAWDGGGSDSNYANALNWAGDVIPGNANNNGALIGSGTTHIVVYNTATNYTSTGTAKANSLLVGTGTNGVGSLTLSGIAGTLTFGGDAYNNAAWIGSVAGNTNATGVVTVSAGKLAITGGTDASINLGVLISGTAGGIKSGTLIINGGTVEVGRRILMGANNSSNVGELTISSGTLDMKRTGSTSEGDLGMIRLGSGTNTVNLDGGTAILSGFRTTEASNARSNIYFNGTTLRANVASADFINGTTTTANYQIKNGGLIFDTNTFAVTINDVLSDFSGHNGLLRKEGTGTLTLSSANNYTGPTTITGGTLALTGTGTLGTGNVIVNGIFDISGISAASYALGTAQVLSGDGTITATGKTLNVNGTLAPGNSAGSLDVTGNVVLAGTTNSNFEIDGPSSNDLLAVTGSLTYAGALNIDTTETTGTFNLFDFGSLSGNFSSITLSNAFNGSLINNSGIWTGTDGMVTATFTSSSGELTFTAIPEPSTLVLGGFALLGFAGTCLRKRSMAKQAAVT